MKKLVTVCLAALFAVSANAMVVPALVYDTGTDGSIQTALNNLGIVFDLRNASNPVTAADLASHSVLVVGWNYLGDMSGLNPDVLDAGITGNILLTGHDPDFHYVYGGNSAAGKFLSQAISFATGSGTGMVALGDYSTGFAYLPQTWGVSATSQLGLEEIDFFTPEGQASGVYDGLTAGDMSNWYNSYHASFNTWGDAFTIFEVGGVDENYMVTIATPEPTTMAILSIGALSLIRRKK
jgi:hypothetical protein